MNSVNRLTGLLRAFYLSFWAPTADSMRKWALAAVVANAGITVTGASVRVTKSGLGCPTWPRCTPESFIPQGHPAHSPINMAIEFGNRMLTFVVLAVALACLIGAVRGEPRRTSLVTLALLQPLGVLVQGLWGGLVVRSALNPFTVSMHFLISIGMIAAAWALYKRCQEDDGPVRPLVPARVRLIGHAMVAAIAAVIVAGVVTTGTGPHSGDVAATRFALDLESVARTHSAFVYIAVAITVGLWLALRATGGPAPAVRATVVLLGVELAQGAIGYLSYFLAIPAFLVAVHVFGATLVWISALRAASSLRTRDPLPGVQPVGPIAASPAAQPG
ncbi:cytochrome c oxidase assembly protein subunit 15 [Sinosporangium album]|uniref:Cytochrome c oxidase assembly protein subunit 15 n=1 Tax=Sinosporangium album TaxID=504805 RepID=A0A1G7WIW8_9ACTN|nr:COX15/CtaA family protein [Sinosporangium album]SDG71902.1 cytochrome c oxidase assembly protein subunit 15 [Sinosporangium album]